MNPVLSQTRPRLRLLPGYSTFLDPELALESFNRGPGHHRATDMPSAAFCTAGNLPTATSDWPFRLTGVSPAAPDDPRLDRQLNDISRFCQERLDHLLGHGLRDALDPRLDLRDK